MSEDAGCAERFLRALFAMVVKPISDLRLLISGLCTVLLALCLPAWAQQVQKIPRIGFLWASRGPSPGAPAGIHQGLRKLGYINGQNITIEYRYAEGKFERLPVLAAELVRLNVDVIVTGGSTATRAAKEATSTIPIVITNDNDPVASGFVASLARPGGNITPAADDVGEAKFCGS